ncbi:hypothetical protein K491DRAFT_693637 [Lophiostoma macrostomum CBS 122681]|uniref:Uncharacterized protein n=1 Tax=Lophiostoma macrostomum CBS 122681 TaxID=1314788 RepID=A0A6A6T7Q7_9PLEO|nr:hypothetical protein K491DRAFT_693637 [Lophiostoma macrostomum CBS 122681]
MAKNTPQSPNLDNNKPFKSPYQQARIITSHTTHSSPPSISTLQPAPGEYRPRPEIPGCQCITILGFWLNENCDHEPWVIRTIRCALHEDNCTRCDEEGCCEYTTNGEGPWRAAKRQRWLDVTLANGERKTYTGCEKCEPGERPVSQRVDILGRPV